MPIKDDTKMIHLDPSRMGIGDLLTQLTRAYLHSRNPSTLVQRILEGVRGYRNQTVEASVEDRTIGATLEHDLQTLRMTMQSLEDRLYPPPPVDSQGRIRD